MHKHELNEALLVLIPNIKSPTEILSKVISSKFVIFDTELSSPIDEKLPVISKLFVVEMFLIIIFLQNSFAATEL